MKTKKKWDQKLPSSMLSEYDLRCIAYAISNPLHYTTETPHCSPDLCAMCGNAMRLVVQAVEPKLRDEFIKRAAHAVGRQHIDVDPPCGDD